MINRVCAEFITQNISRRLAVLIATDNKDVVSDKRHRHIIHRSRQVGESIY